MASESNNFDAVELRRKIRNREAAHRSRQKRVAEFEMLTRTLTLASSSISTLVDKNSNLTQELNSVKLQLHYLETSFVERNDRLAEELSAVKSRLSFLETSNKIVTTSVSSIAQSNVELSAVIEDLIEQSSDNSKYIEHLLGLNNVVASYDSLFSNMSDLRSFKLTNEVNIQELDLSDYIDETIVLSLTPDSSKVDHFLS